MPALIAVGTKDDVAGSPHELAAMMPNAHALDIPDRDHMLAVGDKVFKTGVLEFLDERDYDAAHHTCIGDLHRRRRQQARRRCFWRGGRRRSCCCMAAARPATPGARPPSRSRATGRIAYAVDQRGHGDSDWVESGAYTFTDFAADAARRRRRARPQRSGTAAGRDRRLARRHRRAARGRRGRERSGRNVFSALVLVDITPRVDLAGVDKVTGFMRAHAREGFASIAEAADAVAHYLPHRPRPRSHEGLKKNLRHVAGRPLALALGPALHG